MTLSKLLRGFALSILLAVFSFSAVKLITSTVSSYQEQHAFEELSAYVNTALEPSRSITPISASGQSDVQPSTNPTGSTLHADCINAKQNNRQHKNKTEYALHYIFLLEVIIYGHRPARGNRSENIKIKKLPSAYRNTQRAGIIPTVPPSF